MIDRRALLRLGVVGTAALLSGCSSKNADRRTDRIRLWVAPNEAEEGFWKLAVARWNALARGLPVEFTTIPTAGSSEDTVLSALVAGNEPDLCSNVFSGFAVQLAALNQVKDLASMPGYNALIEQRHMSEITTGWALDGKVYALPIYSSPALIWWRADLLEANGFARAPQTYDEVYALCERYGRRRARYGMQVIAGRTWADRWFDFISFYYAASGGQPYLDGARALYDNAAGAQAAGFIGHMFRQGWTALDFDAEEPLVSGLAAGAVRGPWDIERFSRIYPETLAKITVGPMITPTPATSGTSATFSDSKGVVIFKSSKVADEAFEFLAWILGEEDLNLLWLQRTGLSPARGDLLVNPRFAEYYRANPIDRTYAAHVANAHPVALSEYTIDIQKIMTTKLVEPLMTNQLAPAAALAQAVAQTDHMLRVQM